MRFSAVQYNIILFHYYIIKHTGESFTLNSILGNITNYRYCKYCNINTAIYISTN